MEVGAKQEVDRAAARAKYDLHEHVHRSGWTWAKVEAECRQPKRNAGPQARLYCDEFVLQESTPTNDVQRSFHPCKWSTLLHVAGVQPKEEEDEAAAAGPSPLLRREPPPGLGTPWGRA